jgi:hypothetical protein
MAMVTQATVAPVRKAAGGTTRRFGFWAAVMTAAVTALSFAIAVNTLPVSGPFCQAGCVPYPYHDVAHLVPHDYIWMYPATLLAPIFVVLMACIHHYAAESKKLNSQIALIFAAIAAALLATNYYIQIATMQPSLVKGELVGLALFSQYNPHGIFIALEELGYLMMSLAFLFAGVLFAGPARLERMIRWLLMGGALTAFAAYLVLSLVYGKDLEYRFEVVVIVINWTVLIVGGVLLSILFHRTTWS